jgi:hypothetical protein
MKKLLIAALMLLSATCQQETAVKTVFPIEEISATVAGDKLPVDGCGAHLWLNFLSPSSDSQTFMRLPTAATRSLMDDLIKAEIAKQPAGTLWMGSKEVTIRYRETEQTATLICGWGKKQEVKAIELLDIRER